MKKFFLGFFLETWDVGCGMWDSVNGGEPKKKIGMGWDGNGGLMIIMSMIDDEKYLKSILIYVARRWVYIYSFPPFAPSLPSFPSPTHIHIS